MITLDRAMSGVRSDFVISFSLLRENRQWVGSEGRVCLHDIKPQQWVLKRTKNTLSNWLSTISGIRNHGE